VTLAGLLVAALVAGWGASLPGASAPPALEWGLYQIYWHPRQFAESLDAVQDKLASTPDYIMFYRDLGRPFPADAIALIRERGATPIVSLELWQWHRQQVNLLPQVNAGKFDRHLDAWAAAAKAEGRRVLLRFGFEFNGDWFSWGGQPEAFVAAWQRARSIFRKQGASNVEWVWAPNVVSVPDTPANAWHRYWPGDKDVDWVGLDGYNWGDHHDAWHRWERCADIFAAALAACERRFPGKPLMIAEFASVPAAPAAKAAWIREAHAWLTSQTRVRACIWFNYDKRREGEYDWRIDSSAAALSAFNATFASP
jgi:hypothetical protein